MKRGQFDYPRAEWMLPIMITAENWRDHAKDVDGAVASVAHGYDPIASGNLIRFTHFAFQDEALFERCGNLSEVERGVLNFIALAFKRYVEKAEAGSSISLDVAFGISRGRGRTNEGNEDRNIFIAAAVEAAIRGSKKDRGPVKMEPVCTEVANQVNLGWKSVEKIYTDNQEVIQTMGDTEISALAGALNKSA